MTTQVSSQQGSQHRTGMLAMGAAVALWTLKELTGALLPGHVPVPTIVLGCYIAHLCALVLLTSPRRVSVFVQTSQLPLQIVRGLLMLAMPLSFAAGLKLAPLAAIWAVFWVTPLLVLGFSALLLRELARVQQWGTALVGLVCAVFILQPALADLKSAALPGLGMAVCFSLYLVLTRLLRSDSTTTSLFYTGAMVAGPLAVAAPLYGHIPGLSAWPVLAAIGVIGLGALYAFDHACKLAPLTTLTSVLCLQPIVMVAAATLLTGQRPGVRVLVGAIVVGSAILITGRGYHD